MITEQIIYNINKIDSDLKNLFDSVKIDEKNIGNKFFFELRANSKFKGFNESKYYVNAEVHVLIEKKNLVFDPIKWIYSTNPNNTKADWLEKQSTMETISHDIYSVLTKCKMDQSYFESLEPKLEEKLKKVEKKIEGIQERFIQAFKKNGVTITNFEKIVSPHMENYDFMVRKADETWKFYHDGQLKLSEKLNIESEFEKKFGANWVRFKEGFIEVNYYN